MNNYGDVRAVERRAALTAVILTQGTVRRWRAVRSSFGISLPTINYELSYEPRETLGPQRIARLIIVKLLSVVVSK